MLKYGEGLALVVPLELEAAALALELNFRVRIALPVEQVDDPVRAAGRKEGTLRVPGEDDRALAMVLRLKGEEPLLCTEAAQQRTVSVPQTLAGFFGHAAGTARLAAVRDVGGTMIGPIQVEPPGRNLL